ncbi:acetyl-CoA hydrolase/transferase family protein [Propionibacterium acidifaciens]
MIRPEGLGAVTDGLPDEPRLVAPGGFSTPLELLALLDARLDRWALFCVNAPAGIPSHEGVTHETIFLGPAMRASGRSRYFPMRLSLSTRLFRTTCPPDVVVLHTTAPRGGRVSMGIEVQVMLGALEAVRARDGIVVAQVNPRMPFVHGDGVLSVDDIDYGVEIDHPMITIPEPVPDEASLRLGELIAARVEDGSSIQAGIGAVPDAVLGCLHPRRGLRFWSELVSDGAMLLDRAGALDPDEPLIGTFMLGTQEFYDWVDDNPRVRLRRCEVTNDPAIISTLPKVVSVNTAMQVDLFAQTNATRRGDRIYSGTGGSTDFLVGALHSPGGEAIIALRSRHPKAGVSTVVPKIASPVTSHQMSAIATENGIAQVFGNDEDEQARQIIEHAAHPDARDELREAGGAMGLKV